MPANAALLSDLRNTSIDKSARTESKVSPRCWINEEAEFRRHPQKNAYCLTMSEHDKNLPDNADRTDAADREGIQEIIRQLVQEDPSLLQPSPANPRHAGKNGYQI